MSCIGHECTIHIQPRFLLTHKSAPLQHLFVVKGSAKRDECFVLPIHKLQNLQSVQLDECAPSIDRGSPCGGIFGVVRIVRVSGTDDVAAVPHGIGTVPGTHECKGIRGEGALMIDTAALFVFFPAAQGQGALGLSFMTHGVRGCIRARLWRCGWCRLRTICFCPFFVLPCVPRGLSIF